VLEGGTERDVEDAVLRAMETLAPGGGFILAPSDSINYIGPSSPEHTERVMKNFHKMIETWKATA